ncbi:MAG: hypothetical protein ACREEM_12115 [Blastocatellia bacterium]
MICTPIRISVFCIIAMVPALANSQSANQRKPDPCKVKRNRLRVEEELRVALRNLRQAIDAYKVSCEQGNIGPLDRMVNDYCYPPTLEVMVQGVTPPNRPQIRNRFLRRIPRDPLTGRRDWGLRSMMDEPDSTTWGGQHVFDVYSKSNRTSTEGTRYRDW